MDIFGREARMQRDRQAQELATLHAEVSQLAAEGVHFKADLATVRAEIGQLAAENERLKADLATLSKAVRDLTEQYAHAEKAQEDTTLALQRLALREADLTDLRRRHAQLAKENARLTEAPSSPDAHPNLAPDTTSAPAGYRLAPGPNHSSDGLPKDPKPGDGRRA